MLTSNVRCSRPSSVHRHLLTYSCDCCMLFRFARLHLVRVCWQPSHRIMDKVSVLIADVALARARCPSRFYPRYHARHTPALISRALTQPNSCCAAAPRSCTGALAHAAVVAVAARGASGSATVFACLISCVASQPVPSSGSTPCRSADVTHNLVRVLV